MENSRFIVLFEGVYFLYTSGFILTNVKYKNFFCSLEVFLTKLSDTFEKMRRIEGRVANDQVNKHPGSVKVIIVENHQDLKLSDCLRYHMRDTNAAKDLLYR